MNPMWFISTFFPHLALALRLSAAAPWMPPGVAYAHAEAASEAATEQVPAELLLPIQFVGGGFDPAAVSRVEGRTRKTGHYASTAAPASLDRRSALYCGPLQTYAPSWSACIGMRDLGTGYAAAVAELTQWLRDRRVHGSTVRGLARPRCGHHGVLTGQCNGYPQRVLDMTRRFRDHGPARPSSAPRSIASI